MNQIVTELRARANARHTGEEPSPTAQLCARAADLIEALEAENFKLAAGVCHWVTGNEHGNAYCGDTGKLL